MYRVAATSEVTLRRQYARAVYSTTRNSIFRSSPILSSSYHGLRSISTTNIPPCARVNQSVIAVPKPSSLTLPLRTKKAPNTVSERRYTSEGFPPVIEEELPLQYGLLYIDNAYPLKMGWWDFRYSLFRSGWKSLERRAKNELVPPEDGMPFHFKIGGIEPRLKDGGMFLHFSYVHPSSYTTKEALREIESRCEIYLESHVHHMWFNLQRVRAFLVKGEPFLEDMASRYPNKRIRIEYSGNIGIESMYKLFRKYGQIIDITPLPPVKDMPKQAIVQYHFMRSSTSAKNCLHGAEINGVQINVSYEKTLQGNAIWQWLSNHPRISVPLGGFAVAGISFVIFDPIRVFSIRSKVTKLFNVDEYPVLRWLRKETVGRLTRPPIDPLQATGWREREEEEEKLRKWLRSPPETFAIVQGPRGSGKTDMVEYVIRDKKHKVIIRCEELANARNEAEILTNLAKQIGYIPLFQFMNNLNNIMDMAITATTGQKAGLSATFEGQLEKIFDALTIAIQSISPTKDMSNTSPEAIMKKIESTIKDKSRKAKLAAVGESVQPENLGTTNLDTTWRMKSKAKKEREDEEVSQRCDPDDIPVIVIDGYMSSREKGPQAKELWTFIAEWAAVLVENHIAHVVFISNNVAASKPLSKALPSMTFETIVLSDASLDSALEFVHKRLKKRKYPDLVDSVKVIGGRLTDLELFVQKVKSGSSPTDAVQDILARAVIEVRKNSFDFESSDKKSLGWTSIQFWTVMKQLAKYNAASYDELKIHPLFKDDENAFSAMERSELITIIHKNGRPFSVKPGKPIYHAAFKDIASDESFAAVMDLEASVALDKLEMIKVAKWEGELRELSKLLHKDGSWLFGGGRVPKEVSSRVKWLMKKLSESHVKIEKHEHEINNAKTAVATLAEDIKFPDRNRE
ncbi:mitochondrial escape protein 2 [Entomortierella beljakovae]|nr:mitochondrial escape protein 2 [Entomortierella beljakovae]